MNRNDIINQLAEDGIHTYSVYATVDWTNQIVDHRTFVAPEALGIVADELLFRAWDGDYQTDSTKFGLPQTCSVFAVPSNWKEEAEALKITEWNLRDDLANVRWAVDVADSANDTDLYDHYVAEAIHAESLLDSFRNHSPIHYEHDITINGERKREWRVRSERGMLSAFSRLIDSTQAQRDGAPTPVFSEAPEDPTLGPPRKVLGPYSD